MIFGNLLQYIIILVEKKSVKIRAISGIIFTIKPKF